MYVCMSWLTNFYFLVLFLSVTSLITPLYLGLFHLLPVVSLMIIYNVHFVMAALVLIIVLPVPYLAFTAVSFVVAYRITIGLKIQTFDRDQPFQEGCLAWLGNVCKSTLEMKTGITWLREFALVWTESIQIGKVHRELTWFLIYFHQTKETKGQLQRKGCTIFCESVAHNARNQCLSFIHVPLVNIFQTAKGKNPGSWEKQTLW